MSKFKEIKNLHNILVEYTNDIEFQLHIQLKKIKQEYNNILFNEKIKLLVEICNGENLDIDTIKYKYINSKDLIKYKNNNIINDLIFDDELLDKIEIDNIEYYYEKKENGKVYDLKSNIVGVFKDNKINLN